MRRRLGEYSIGLDVVDAGARGGVIGRNRRGAYRSRALFGASIGRSGAVERQLWPI